MNVFQTFPDTIFTPKEWFLSKKGPKEGERVARGHFHERVGESPIHWLPPGVGFTMAPNSSDLVPSPVAVAVAEDNRRQDNSHHTQREDHLGYHFGTFWGPMEPLWVVEFHRLNWF